MIIRPTEARDLPDIAALTNHFIRNTAIHFGVDDVSPDELRAHWEHAHPTYPWLTAETDDHSFAGFAKAGSWRARHAYRHTAETAIYIHPDARRRGIARALYTALLDDLRARGFHTAVAGITLPNDPSVALHEALGFAYVATFRQVGRKFDRWHDVAFYQILLNAQDPPIP